MIYRVLGPAVRDLQQIEDWVSAEFGEAAAEKASQRLLKTFEMLARYQGIGRIRPELADAPIRFLAQPPNWIVYRPGDPLMILRIISSRIEPRKLSL